MVVGDFLKIIFRYNLAEEITSVYGENYYNSFKPISGFYEYENYICELYFDDFDINDKYFCNVTQKLYNALEDNRYVNTIDGEPLLNLKTISPPFYKILKKKFKDTTTMYLWEKEISIGDIAVKEAIELLENNPIQNGEGNYVMYLKFDKKYIGDKFFDLFETDFNVVNDAMKKLKVGRYYELNCNGTTFNGFEEIQLSEIIGHINEYTSYDGEYRFFTFYKD